jgi:hypothetical protein
MMAVGTMPGSTVGPSVTWRTRIPIFGGTELVLEVRVGIRT